MAGIAKKITFEGTNYNLDDKDRVAAEAAVNGTAGRAMAGSGGVSISFAAGAGSIAGNANSGVITVATQATSGNDVTVTFDETPVTTPTCVYNTDLSNFTLVESSTGFALDVSGNTGTGTLSYICL
jgi:hypothetical protein